MPGVFLPPPVAGKRRKKTVAGTRVNESMTLNLAQRSLKVIDFGIPIESAYTYSY